MGTKNGSAIKILNITIVTILTLSKPFKKELNSKFYPTIIKYLWSTLLNLYFIGMNKKY